MRSINTLTILHTCNLITIRVHLTQGIKPTDHFTNRDVYVSVFQRECMNFSLCERRDHVEHVTVGTEYKLVMAIN